MLYVAVVVVFFSARGFVFALHRDAGQSRFRLSPLRTIGSLFRGQRALLLCSPPPPTRSRRRVGRRLSGAILGHVAAIVRGPKIYASARPKHPHKEDELRDVRRGPHASGFGHKYEARAWSIYI